MTSKTQNPFLNVPADGVSYFTPAQKPSSGTAITDSRPLLFKPLTVRSTTFQNRIFLSPLCQYSADDGHMTEWHRAHLGGIFTRGPGLAMIEATSVTPEGRITPQDLGLWKDSQKHPMAEIVAFAHSQGQKMGIQLGHAGRKASTVAPWLSFAAIATEELGGWPNNVLAPSSVKFGEGYPEPREMSVGEIKGIVKAFADAAKRAIDIGLDVIEIHNAHGYALHSFLSPHSNKRTDEYGGSFENRIRFTLEVVDAVRAAIPQDTPLFLRISADEWVSDEPSWTIDDTVRLAPILAEHGVDYLDISSGGNNPNQKIKGGPAYQSGFAQQVKKAVGDKLLVGTVGSITSGTLAQSLLEEGRADVVSVGRGFQRNPGLVWDWADELEVDIQVAHQIGWGFKGRGGRPKKRQEQVHEEKKEKPVVIENRSGAPETSIP